MKQPFRFLAPARVLPWTTVSMALVMMALLLASQVSWGQDSSQQADQSSAATVARLKADISILAADDFEGRGPGTKGIDKAADYIAARFKELGLKVDSYEGSPFQHFELPNGASVGEANSVTLQGPKEMRTELELNTTFTPLSIGGSGKLDMPLVFAGYGITAPDLEYDDYDGLDVRGKAVIVLQGEPQQTDGESKFNGSRATIHSQDTRKVSNAYQHGAEAVILVANATAAEDTRGRVARLYERAVQQINEANEEFAAIEAPTLEQMQAYKTNITTLAERAVQRAEAAEAQKDPLVPFAGRGGRGGRGATAEEGRDLPVLSITRGMANALLAAAEQPTLEQIEASIDEAAAPRSFELGSAKIQGEVSVKREIFDCKNVVGVLPATEDGPLADETIVIGAHYDHLGYGGRGSLSGGSTDIHNGADDNGSGTVGVLELARRFSQMPTRRRRMVFILFSAEERGLIGSAYHADNPLFPLDQTVTMINLDMIGRLRDNKLTIRGTGTAPEYEELIDRINEKYAFEINKVPEGNGPSDHSSFYRKNLPVLDFFTNTHEDYHRPTDDFDKLNTEGMSRIVAMTQDLTTEVLNADKRILTFQTADTPPANNAARGGRGGRGDGSRAGNATRGGDAARGGNTDTARGGRGNTTGDGDMSDEPRPWFGAVPDFSVQVEGVQLMGTSAGSPAAKAGMKAGDIIVELGGNRIGTLEDLDGALRKFKVGDKVRVVAMRGDEKVILEVALDVRPDDGE